MRRLTTALLAGSLLIGLHAVPVNAAPPAKADPQTVSWEEKKK